jgi:hypothetical protein
MNTDDDLIAQSPDSFKNAMLLLAVAIDSKAVMERLKSWEAEKAAADQKMAALAQKEAAVDKKVAEQATAFAKEKIELEDEWQQFEEWKSAEEARIAAAAGKVPALENIISCAIQMILSESGVRQHPLAGPPDLISLLQGLLGGKGAHSADTTDRQDVSFEPAETLEHAPAAASLRRSKSIRRIHASNPN